MAEIVIYEYEMPDGSILELEGEIGQEALADAEAKKEQAKIQQQIDLGKLESVVQESRPSAVDYLKDIGRSALTGAFKSYAGLAGLPGMVERAPSGIAEYFGAENLKSYFDALSKISPRRGPLPGGYRYPTYEMLKGAGETVLPFLKYEPQTVPGGYTEAITEFTTAPLSFARTPSGVAQGLIVGTGTGAVQESLEQAGVGPAGQLGGALATGIGLGLLTSPSRAERILQQTMKTVDQTELNLAKELQAQAKELGINITAPELIDNQILQALAAKVYGSESGSQIMYSYLKQRPEQVKNVAKGLLNELSENPDSLRDFWKSVGTTGEKVVKDAKNARTIASKESYQISNKEFVDEESVLNLIKEIDRLIADPTSSIVKGSTTYLQLKSLKQQLTKKKVTTKDEPITIYDASGKPLTEAIDTTRIIPQTNVNKLDSIFKQWRDQVRDSRANQIPDKKYMDKQGQFIFLPEGGGGVLNKLEDIILTNPNYAKAKRIYSAVNDELTTPVINNIDQLSKGKIQPSTIKQFVLDPEKNNASDITKTYKLLNAKDPNVFPGIARIYIENLVNKRLVKKKTGDDPAAGFKLYDDLVGTEGKSANFNAMLKGVAEANEVNPNNVILGWKNFNSILERTGRLVNINNPALPPDPRFLSKDAAQIGSFMWRIKFANKFSETLQKRTNRQLANIFTSPNSVKTLEELGKLNVGSRDAINRVIYLLSINGFVQAEPQEQPIAQ